MSEDELYRQYLSGNKAAGDALMLRLGDALTAYLAAFLHNIQDAEDLMLDCFTLILVDKPRIAENRFRAYLFRVARNKANRLWRIRFRRNEFSLDESVAALPSPEASPQDTVEKKETHAALNRCLNRIAVQYREALCLYYDMGMSYAETAEVLGCGKKRVEDLLRNGKKRLRLELEKEGIMHADV